MSGLGPVTQECSRERYRPSTVMECYGMHTLGTLTNSNAILLGPWVSVLTNATMALSESNTNNALKLFELSGEIGFEIGQVDKI